MVKRCFWSLLGLGAAVLAAIAARPASGSSTPCGDGKDSYFIEWMVVSASRAHFHSAPAREGDAPAELRGYLIRGDFVFVRRPEPPEYPPTGMDAGFACVRYVPSGGAATYGWVRKSDLVALNVGNEAEGPEPPEALKSTLAAMPALTSWPKAGKTPGPVHWEHDFVGNFLCVSRFEPAKGSVCVVTTARSAAGPECGPLGPGNRYATFEAEGWYIAYRLNNGIAVVSQNGSWGNHSQSDPAGFYAPSGVATLACPRHIAPR